MKELKEKRIAVVGVSDDHEKHGHRVFRDLVTSGYQVDGVNIHGGTVYGREMHRTLAELGYVPDLVITVVPPAATEKIVEDCKKIGVPEIWMQPGSESESAIAAARAAGMAVVHHACIMVDSGVW